MTKQYITSSFICSKCCTYVPFRIDDHKVGWCSFHKKVVFPQDVFCTSYVSNSLCDALDRKTTVESVKRAFFSQFN